MSERRGPNPSGQFLLTQADGRNPELILARVIANKRADLGVICRFQRDIIAVLIPPEKKVYMEELWQDLIKTQDFQLFQLAFNGEVSRLEDGHFMPREFLGRDPLVFNLLQINPRIASLTYVRAIEKAEAYENYQQAKDLRLQAHRLGVNLNRSLAPFAMKSYLGRLYNLVTTGKEQAGPIDWFVDVLVF